MNTAELERPCTRGMKCRGTMFKRAQAHLPSRKSEVRGRKKEKQNGRKPIQTTFKRAQAHSNHLKRAQPIQTISNGRKPIQTTSNGRKPIQGTAVRTAATLRVVFPSALVSTN
jgi:hypothetical protein